MAVFGDQLDLEQLPDPNVTLKLNHQDDLLSIITDHCDKVFDKTEDDLLAITANVMILRLERAHDAELPSSPSLDTIGA